MLYNLAVSIVQDRLDIMTSAPGIFIGNQLIWWRINASLVSGPDLNFTPALFCVVGGEKRLQDNLDCFTSF